ncbi:Lrp/AsnC family transcriptional regulator [Marinomonas sp. M1K-6]|uniref:Lrp/AsnC family transcriptional regulator n=1 Tax=Marinomonas profundi TaxID=2726122 RepID=A0A847QVE8_9GAMM|nr:Lrp/AsnC family transcriptional regulator [Marinomonas profundi]NLQ16878.1 Lrp/AsnC family transcriptional regulator [Marinomonas profundi]UDV02610.1 Lrp/AsnC family transcriptional regulator [Marinomonas profundi]
MNLDEIDLQLLALIQSDDSISTESMAQHVGLSKTPCWRRIQKLESAGFIKRRVALLDADKLGLGVSVFVQVKTNQHDANWADEFARVVAEFPEVVEFYRMAGEYDYLLRVLVKDIPAYDQFYKRLISATALTDVTSNFAMEQIKWTTQLPLPSPKA